MIFTDFDFWILDFLVLFYFIVHFRLIFYFLVTGPFGNNSF